MSQKMSFQDPVFRRGQEAVADASLEAAAAASSASPEPKKAANKRGRKATKTQKQPCREDGLSGNFFLSPFEPSYKRSNRKVDTNE